MAARKKVAKKKTARRKAAKRELIDTGTNKLFVRRNKRGTSFKEVEDVGRSLTQDGAGRPRVWPSAAKETEGIAANDAEGSSRARCGASTGYSRLGRVC
jgi:hypothetical protein